MPTSAEQLVAAVNHLAREVGTARSILTDRALVALIADATGGRVSQKTIKIVLAGIVNMPSIHLTAHGRMIHIREE